MISNVFVSMDVWHIRLRWIHGKKGGEKHVSNKIQCLWVFSSFGLESQSSKYYKYCEF